MIACKRKELPVVLHTAGQLAQMPVREQHCVPPGLLCCGLLIPERDLGTVGVIGARIYTKFR